MENIPKSGFHLSNQIALILLTALKEVIGDYGINAILNHALLSQYIDNFPPGNQGRDFDFSDLSMIIESIEELYGARGGRSLAMRAGRAAFPELLRAYGIQAGVGDSTFLNQPLTQRLGSGLNALAWIFNANSDQLTSVTENDDHFLYTNQRCPCCWGRKSEQAGCSLTSGMLSALFHWLSDGNEFRVIETQCCALSNPVCEFTILREPII